MQAIVFDEPGDESVLRLGEAPSPSLRSGCVRIRTRAAGVNRADLVQRMGGYPAPPGASALLGLEVAGEVVEVADGVSAWKPGDRVMALLPGGGYAEESVVHAGSVMAIPEGLSFTDAAALPEVLLTVYRNVFQLGELPRGGGALVHGGGSGIGTAAIQMIKAWGATVVVTAGSAEKCQQCLDLGADFAANYREDDFVAVAKEASGGRGVDVVLDHIGGAYLEKNCSALAVEGRLVVIGLMGGAKGDLPLGALLMKRLRVIGSTLRALPEEQKAEIVAGFQRDFGAAVEKGEIRPIVDRVLPIAEAAEAHRVMQASTHFGKIVLEVG